MALLHANTLRTNQTKKREIDKQVKDILSHYDDEIKVAHERGIHEVNLAAPITFGIPYMSNKDAQRIIYYMIIKSLKERGFNVYIDIQEQATSFEITWITNEERHDITLQTNLIAQHTKKAIGKIDLSADG